MKAWAIVDPKNDIVTFGTGSKGQNVFHGAKLILACKIKKELEKVTILSGETIKRVEIKILEKSKRRK